MTPASGRGRRRCADAAELPLHALPPEVAARRLLLQYLEKGEKAAGRLIEGVDPKSLHDFRVALRRFRAAERAYRPWLGDAVPKKLRKRLREVVQGTGPARDGEVQLAWLREQRQHLRGAQSNGFRWMLRRLEERQQQAEQDLRQALPSEFSLLAARLGAALRLPADIGTDRFGRATGERLKPLAAELSLHLGAIAQVDGPRHVHPARLMCKRVRYLLEPIAEALPDLAGVTEELARLQDLLGDVHDAAVLGEALAAAAAEAAAAELRRLVEAPLQPGTRARAGDPRAGLLALAKRLADQQRQGMAVLRQRHAEDADARLLERLGAAVESLLAVPAGSGDSP